MAIASISGSSSAQAVRTSMEPIKGVSNDLKSEKKSAGTIVEQENADKNSMKTDIDNPKDSQKLNGYKGIQEVDVKI